MEGQIHVTANSETLIISVFEIGLVQGSVHIYCNKLFSYPAFGLGKQLNLCAASKGLLDIF